MSIKKEPSSPAAIPRRKKKERVQNKHEYEMNVSRDPDPVTFVEALRVCSKSRAGPDFFLVRDRTGSGATGFNQIGPHSRWIRISDIMLGSVIPLFRDERLRRFGRSWAVVVDEEC